MIALSGAHTIGQKGFGDPYTFDNEYFVTLKKDPWNLPNLTKGELEGTNYRFVMGPIPGRR